MITESLSRSHNLDDFDCGNDQLNEWLKHRALSNKPNFSQTYVAIQNSKVIAFYALAAGSILRAEMPKSIARNSPTEIPVFLLARIAVVLTCQGKGVGRVLLKEAVLRCISAQQHVGAAALKVVAKNEVGIQFYKSNGFVASPTDPFTLYLKLPY